MPVRFSMSVLFVEDEPDAPLAKLDMTAKTVTVNLDKYYELPERDRLMIVSHEAEHFLVQSNLRALRMCLAAADYIINPIHKETPDT